jgi:hypothetical protein
MYKKYEITEEKYNQTAYSPRRIRALRDFSDVKAGDLGGLGTIETQETMETTIPLDKIVYVETDCYLTTITIPPKHDSFAQCLKLALEFYKCEFYSRFDSDTEITILECNTKDDVHVNRCTYELTKLFNLVFAKSNRQR